MHACKPAAGSSIEASDSNQSHESVGPVSLKTVAWVSFFSCSAKIDTVTRSGSFAEKPAVTSQTITHQASGTLLVDALRQTAAFGLCPCRGILCCCKAARHRNGAVWMLFPKPCATVTITTFSVDRLSAPSVAWRVME